MAKSVSTIKVHPNMSKKELLILVPPQDKSCEIAVPIEGIKSQPLCQI